jgi:exonuclease SbcC
MSYKDTTVDLREDGVYNLIGQNGAGKSAIRDAISWCLFGKSRVSGSGDDLIRKNENEMYVILSLDIRNKLYKITRFKETGQSTKLDILGTESENKNTFKETQEYLLQLLGFDYEVFHNTFCFEQNNADSFSQLNPKESKQLIMKLLQLQIYEVYDTHSKLILSRLENNLSALLIKQRTLSDMNKTLAIDEGKIHGEISLHRTNLGILKNNLQLAEIQKQINELKLSQQKFLNLCKCPTCLQTVGEEHKKEISNKFETKINTLFRPDLSSVSLDTYELKSRITIMENLIAKNKTLIEENQRRTIIEKLDFVEMDMQLKQLSKDIAIYKKLALAFGRNGIPSLIIENCIPEIEGVANALLEDLEVEMRIGLNLQRELKSGELGDTLDILIYRDKYEMSYFNYSGGERFIIDLVLRIALSILLLRRKGCGNSTLIIDEGMGNLDKFNREKFLKLISIVNEKYSFKKAIIISHISDIQDNIGKKIKIVKYGNTSSIEV